MIGHYLRHYLRQMRRQKTHQLIGVFGLAVGIGAVLAIAAWLRFETGYDKFHNKAERLYRIYNVQEYSSGNLDVAVTPFPLGPALSREFPEVEASLRLWYGPGIVLSRGATRAFEAGLIYADSNFFELFDYPLLAGNAASVLDRKSSAVISSTLAEKYFGDEDPIGKTLRVNNQSDLVVTGVMSPMPSYSHLATSLVISLPTVSDDWSEQRRESWGSNGYSTYVLLRPGTEFAHFAARLEPALKQFRRNDTTTRLYAQAVSDIHLGPALVADNANVADPRRLWLFATVAVMILLIACINYVNLATARAGLRLREFGVRSCLGAALGQIRRQIVWEALIASAGAVLIALALIELAFPVLRDILNPDLPREALRDPFVLVIMPLVWLLTGAAAGTIPAFTLARHSPSRMLRDHRQSGRQVRRILVILQFGASVVLIVFTAVIFRQQQFMLATALSTQAEQLLVIPLRGEEARQHYETLQQQLSQLRDVNNATAVAQLPHQIVWSSTYNWEGQNPGEEILFNTNNVDAQFLQTFNLSLTAGRNFRAGESEVCLINETARKRIGWDDAVGKTMFLDDSLPATVVGVVQDFHFSSFRDAIAPLVLFPQDGGYANLVLRLAGSDLPKTLAAIESTAGRVLPNTPYRSFFLDQAFDRLYAQEIRMQKTIAVFAILAIALACLGLFGLASFSIERRTKEVGIRKVMGASTLSLIRLHVREYINWLLLANLIAWPVALFLSRNWLAGFAYRTSTPWWLFVCAGLATLVLALATVIIQTTRAAIANPVQSLRYE